MTNYVFQFTNEIKGYRKYELDGMPGAVYIPLGMVSTAPPVSITITVPDGAFITPKPAPVLNPENSRHLRPRPTNVHRKQRNTPQSWPHRLLACKLLQPPCSL